MWAGPKADAPLLWNLGRDWKQIVLGWERAVLKHRISRWAPIRKTSQIRLKGLGIAYEKLWAARADAVIRLRRWLK